MEITANVAISGRIQMTADTGICTKTPRKRKNYNDSPAGP
jgi:hypothetical protein